MSGNAREIASGKRDTRIIEELAPACGHLRPVAIGRVFSNLIRNAIKHNPPGVTISVTTRCTAQGVTAEVRDNRTGNPEPDLTRVFDRFHRRDKSCSKDRGGCGPGLDICKTIIEAHGGRISGENNPDGGACFRFTLLGTASR